MIVFNHKHTWEETTKINLREGYLRPKSISCTQTFAVCFDFVFIPRAISRSILWFLNIGVHFFHQRSHSSSNVLSLIVFLNDNINVEAYFKTENSELKSCKKKNIILNPLRSILSITSLFICCFWQECKQSMSSCKVFLQENKLK